jgi:hypothetical protein
MFALVTLLPIIVRLASGPDDVHSAMAVLATIFLAAMLAIGYRIHATIDESFRLRFENRDLIGNLKREKALLESRVNERTAAPTEELSPPDGSTPDTTCLARLSPNGCGHRHPRRT